ncbi:MAG TPA: NAD(P)-dependent oxidoreductase [Chloroflexota bacterium]|nr:NAD(P)-dependent oxidoreductase [Chloroflexota bacterium]
MPISRRAIVVLGGSGFVGSRLVELWRRDPAVEVIAPTHTELDVLDAQQLTSYIERTQAGAVVNLAAWADVDGAEAEAGDTHGRVHALNADYPGALAALCQARRTYLLHISTDYVFDGTLAARPYREDDQVNPLCWYAVTKAAGERRVLEAYPGACVARIEMPFSGLDLPKKDVARIFQARLEAGQTIAGVVDQNITPLFLDHAARAIGLLIESRCSGIMHVASTTSTTPYAYAQAVAARLRLNSDLIQPVTLETFAAGRPARRPQHSWLDVSQFEQRFGPGVLQSVETELDCWAEQRAGRSSRGDFRDPAQSVRLE